jgi:hypothetical protein
MAVLECPTPKAPALLLVRTRAQRSKALIPQRQAYHDSDTEAESRGAYTRDGGQSSQDVQITTTALPHPYANRLLKLL